MYVIQACTLSTTGATRWRKRRRVINTAFSMQSLQCSLGLGMGLMLRLRQKQTIAYSVEIDFSISNRPVLSRPTCSRRVCRAEGKTAQLQRVATAAVLTRRIAEPTHCCIVAILVWVASIKVSLPVGDLDPSLTHLTRESAPTRHLDLFNRFCRVHLCVRTPELRCVRPPHATPRSTVANIVHFTEMPAASVNASLQSIRSVVSFTAVSCPSVPLSTRLCHKPTLYRNGWTDARRFSSTCVSFNVF